MTSVQKRPLISTIIPSYNRANTVATHSHPQTPPLGKPIFHLLYKKNVQNLHISKKCSNFAAIIERIIHYEQAGDRYRRDGVGHSF